MDETSFIPGLPHLFYILFLTKAKSHKMKRHRLTSRGPLLTCIFGIGVICILIASNQVVRNKRLDLFQSEKEDSFGQSASLYDSVEIPVPLIPKEPGDIFIASRRIRSLRHRYYHGSELSSVNISNATNTSLSNSSLVNSTVKNSTKSSLPAESAEERCALYGGIHHCPDWVLLDSPCSPAKPCRDLSLQHHYVHPACQPSWTGRRRDGTRFYTRTAPNGAAATVGDGGLGHRRRRWSRRRGPSVDWYANGLPATTTHAYPGRYNGGNLRWSPQPRPPYVHGFYPGTCEPDNYQAAPAPSESTQ